MDDQHRIRQSLHHHLTACCTGTERLVLLLWKVEGMNDAEISATLDLPEALVIGVRQALWQRLEAHAATERAASSRPRQASMHV